MVLWRLLSLRCRCRRPCLVRVGSCIAQHRCAGAECLPTAAGDWLPGGTGSEGAAGVAPPAGILSLGFDRYLGHRHRRGSTRWRLGTAVAALVEADLGNSPRTRFILARQASWLSCWRIC